MRLLSAVIFIFCVLFESHVFAHIPEALLGQPITHVEIEGSDLTELSQAEIAIPLQAPLTRQLTRDLITRMLQSGRWGDVQVDAEAVADGVSLLIRVVARTVVIRVEIVGNQIISDDDIKNSLGISQGDDVDLSMRESFNAIITRIYANRGWHHPDIRISLYDTNDASRKVLHIEIIENEPTRIDHISFNGDSLPSPLPEFRLFRVEQGDIVNRQTIENEVRRAETHLRRLGWIEASFGRPEINIIDYKANLSIPSHIGPRYQVIIRGASPLSRSAVENVLQIGENVLDDASIAVMEDRVRDLYTRNGFLDARIQIRRILTRTANEARLLVTIQTGLVVRVQTRRFQGAHHFTTDELDHELTSYLTDLIRGSSFTEPVDRRVASQLFQSSEVRTHEVRTSVYVPPEQVYYAPAYTEAISHIRELYAAAGYLSIRIDTPQLTRISSTEAEVTIPIEEGVQTRLFELQLVGNSNISAHDILETAQLERDAPFSEVATQEARQRILNLYQNRGYLYATITSHTRFSEDRSRAAIRFQIDERFVVHVDSIQIIGAETTSLSLIRSLITFNQGDLFTPLEAQKTQERLMDLGIFSGVTVTPLDPELPAAQKTILITVAERSRQFLDFSAGISTAQGVRGAFEYGYRNLFGYGLQLTLRVQLSGQFFFLDPVLQERYDRLSLEDRLERRVTGNLLLPALPRLPNVRLSLALGTQRENERNFGIDKNSVDFVMSYRPSRNFSWGLTSSLENNDVALFVDGQTYEEVLTDITDPSVRRLLRVPEGRTTLVATSSTWTLDYRDNLFTPTRGLYSSLAIEWARSIGTKRVDLESNNTDFFSHHLRTSVSLSGYIPVHQRITLALQGRYGRVIHLSNISETYPNRQFFLGGIDTMRAYRQDAMIPQDIADEILKDSSIDPSLIIQGGDTFLLLKSELRFPIVGDLGAAVFAEFGNLWVEASSFNILDLRPTAGIGLRIQTPIGPIALDYGFNFLYKRPDRLPLNERFGAFNFSIGVF